MLNSILVGIILAIATIIIHAAGTSSWIEFLQHNEKKFQNRWREINVLACTAIVLLLIHIAEVLLWATAYYLIIKDQFTNFEDAAYFSSVTFTTLGYGDIVLKGDWRMLSAFQAMIGLLVFGWSTALLFTVVQRIWKRKYETNGE